MKYVKNAAIEIGIFLLMVTFAFATETVRPQNFSQATHNGKICGPLRLADKTDTTVMVLKDENVCLTINPDTKQKTGLLQ